jgi:hypothetical protein
MANLSDRTRRGQILLVTGFALAVAFIGLALVLNSVIFTENLATRSESTTTSDAIAHANVVETATEKLVTYVNTYNTTNSSSYDAVDRNLTRGFENVSSVATEHQLFDGQVVNDTLRLYDEGTLVQQTNESRNFTSDDHANNWVLAQNPDGARELQVNVGNVDTSLLPIASPEFSVVATNGTDTWQLNVTDTGDVEVIENGVTIGSCGYSTTPFWVNVSAGTVDDSDCPYVDVFRERGLSGADTLEFRNAKIITDGTYSTIVNESFSGVEDDNPWVADQPYIQPAVYAADVSVAYNNQVISYATELRVAPGESDD